MELTQEMYKKFSTPPSWAVKRIEAGRLRGKSDINPQFRIDSLTELFGLCGFGWYYNVTKKWLETSPNGEIVAFVDIELFIKVGSEWSKPIVGNGGAMFVSNEKAGIYTSDEAFKMATTDALSVCCKQIGIAADIYRGESYSKYDVNKDNLNDNGGKLYDAKRKQIAKLLREIGDDVLTATVNDWLLSHNTLYDLDTCINKLKTRLNEAGVSYVNP